MHAWSACWEKCGDGSRVDAGAAGGARPRQDPVARSGSRAAAAEIEAQRAALAARHRPAVRLANRDEERMILVEQRGIGWQVRFEERARLLVARGAPEQTVAHEHAARVGVGHEDRALRPVEQDRVGRLGPEPRYGEE